MSYLHGELPTCFKVILNGLPWSHKEFRNGDKLSITNQEPEDGDYALLQRHGRHVVVVIRKSEYDPSMDLLLGTIVSYERSCLAGYNLFLGDERVTEHGASSCRGCYCLVITEQAGKVTAYCQVTASKKLVKCTSEKAGKCRKGNRAGSWGE